ncbi:nuclear mRNA export, poly(A)+RNA binding protein [Ascosphaera pollenicola]|nr:nuclear mRNA export, poly(A)+RNA binding protein [Ascosphaera pollenicola]
MMRGKSGPKPRPNTNRGGIRKRTAGGRTDRDGDLDMDSGRASGKIAKRGRGDARGRGDLARKFGNHHGAGDSHRTDALQDLITSGSSQVNVRSKKDFHAAPSGKGKPFNFVEISIRGWRDGQAALDADGGVKRLISFIEKKASPRNNAGRPIKITKWRKEGDALIVSVRSDQAHSVNRINGYEFIGDKLSIKMLSDNTATASQQPEYESQSTADIKVKMTLFLNRRYLPETKALDLSQLRKDPGLIEMGMFESPTTEAKVFPALMKVCELTYESIEKRSEAIKSITLAFNELNNVTTVTTLSQTFPQLLNLNLSNNNISTFDDLIAWRWKFRDLDSLDLSNNPISTNPAFKDTLMKWYPKLRSLNQVMVRTAEEVAAINRTPIPVVGPSFRDENQIAENFIKGFFVGFDTDRENIVRGIYDTRSTFSLNVNTTLPKALQGESSGWEHYIRKSRNLMRLNSPAARLTRMYTGAEQIMEAWKSLPTTRHPNILTSPQDWLVECHPIPALPDYSGAVISGVGGLLITVHGKFDELDTMTGKVVQTRSFDRVFTLGPGAGIGGLRVNNDVLTLRHYGGNEAWIPDGTPIARAPGITQAVVPAVQTPSVAPSVTPSIVPSSAAAGAAPQSHPQAKAGYGLSLPGKPETQVNQEQAVLQVSFQTNMTLEYSEMALTANGWNVEAALKDFERLKAQGSLPPTAFLRPV